MYRKAALVLPPWPELLARSSRPCEGLWYFAGLTAPGKRGATGAGLFVVADGLGLDCAIIFFRGLTFGDLLLTLFFGLVEIFRGLAGGVSPPARSALITDHSCQRGRTRANMPSLPLCYQRLEPVSADIIAAPLSSPRELLDALFRELDAPVNDSDCSALR